MSCGIAVEKTLTRADVKGSDFQSGRFVSGIKKLSQCVDHSGMFCLPT